MKKYLFIFMGVLSFFFFSDSVSALSFTTDSGVEIEVDNEEKLLDYCYYTYVKNTDNFSDYFTLIKQSNGRYFFYTYNSDYILYRYNNNGHILLYAYSVSTSSNKTYVYRSFESDFTYIKQSVTSGGAMGTVLYSNIDIYTSNSFDTIYFSSNTSTNEIENRYSEVVPKEVYTITYYINNELYQTIEVEEGSSHDLLEYSPPKNYQFNGWEYDSSVDLTNITSNVTIYGTTSYVRPNMNYSEDIDSIIHELSVSIIGKNVPVEFDYVYTIMDFIILLVLVFCVVMPFVIIIKLLSGRW